LDEATVTGVGVDAGLLGATGDDDDLAITVAIEVGRLHHDRRVAGPEGNGR
jgi:hypothetical protein